MNLYIIRHGQAMHNKKQVLDENPKNKTLLTKKGIQQVKRKAENLKNIPFSIIFASQYPRTQQTAKIINLYQSPKIKIKIDRRLNERKTGLDGVSVKKWRNISRKNKFHIQLPRGESFQEEKARINSFIKDLKKQAYLCYPEIIS